MPVDRVDELAGETQVATHVARDRLDGAPANELAGIGTVLGVGPLEVGCDAAGSSPGWIAFVAPPPGTKPAALASADQTRMRSPASVMLSAKTCS